MCKREEKASKNINKICAFFIILAIICFLIVLFEIAIYIHSVKTTVIESCELLISLFNKNSMHVTMITAEELKSAQNYIMEAASFFSVASNNNIIAIIYAFSTTVILTIGSFIVSRINKKGDDFSTKITELETKFNRIDGESKTLIKSITDMKNEQDLLSTSIQDMNSKCNELVLSLSNATDEITNNTKKMHLIKELYLKSLDLQNITNYSNYAIMLFKECELNLDNRRDNFDLLNVVINSLSSIPENYMTINIDEIKSMFDQNTVELGKILSMVLLDLRNHYKSLIKHYLDIHKKDNDTSKANQKDISCNSIKDIIEDLMDRLNDDFFVIDLVQDE